MKKMMIIAVLIFCVLSSQMENVAPQVDCYDACSTGCVQSNSKFKKRRTFFNFFFIFFVVRGLCSDAIASARLDAVQVRFTLG
ncbi:hypothetical protein Goshw_026125 [Gossypium schwendimanii]|uniref:Uncharacterized protein n=1 Tax=Gossypium schwendimanii TaxID=34291 RepID=A0A7J9N3N9_GOSSC|nr:hypothetical protein [Gossypium schwendimanii]